MRPTVILLWIVILFVLQSIVTSSILPSNATQTNSILPSETVVETTTEYSVELNENDEEKKEEEMVDQEKNSTLDYKLMKMGSKHSWRQLLYGIRQTEKSLRVNITNSVPTHYKFQSCNETIWKSNGPIKDLVIDFKTPWVQHLWKLLISCDAKYQFAVYTATDNSTRNTVAHVDFSEHIITTKMPKYTETDTQEIRIRGHNESLFDVRINGMIYKAMTSNGAWEIHINTTWSPMAIHFQLAKCDLLFNFTLKIPQNETFVVNRTLLKVFYMIKHTYCSDGIEDDLSFQLRVVWPSRAVTKSIKIQLVNVPPVKIASVYGHPDEINKKENDESYFWYWAPPVLLFFLITAVTLPLIYRHFNKQVEYYVNYQSVVENNRSRRSIIQTRIFKRNTTILEPADENQII